MPQMESFFIFVEGPDDQRFFEKVVEPSLLDKYSVKFIKYANLPIKDIRKFIKVAAAHKHLYICDLDDHPCITKRKEKIQKKYDLKPITIKIVKREIESWYLSGLDDKGSTRLNVWPYNNTEDLSKEEVMTKFKPKGLEVADFKIELLKSFSLQKACLRNASFQYLLDCINSVESII